jgi:hypothetical protein
MKNAIEMGSGIMIYIPSFRHSNINRGRYTDTQTPSRSHKPTIGE